MNLYIKGKGKITLNKNNFVSSGGEGNIYAKNSVAYKIYIDSKKMIPENKINELSILKNKNIISPLDIIMDDKKNNIGYTMKHLKNVSALCQIFTKSFKDRNNISPNDIIELVDQLRDNIKYCHSKNILLVDINELNFLINSRTFKTIYFIDVDSYQTSNYPATAIMESIKDRHSKNFSKETDWFSFGIITFQMFVGIHPYKGKHKNYKTLDERMLNNISVFNSKVKIPPITLPFDLIPESYREWYKAIFESGKRIEPPFDSKATIIIPTVVKIIKGNKNFIIDFIKEFEGDIIQIIDDNVHTTKGLYINDKLNDKIASYSQIAITPIYKHIITSISSANKLLLYDASNNNDIIINFSASQVMSYDKRIYIRYEDNIFELIITETNENSSLFTFTTVCNILKSSSQMFDGVIIQNLLGEFFVSIFPESLIHYQIKLPKLCGYRILDAKYKNKVLIIIGEKKGSIDEFIFILDDNYRNYYLRKNENINYIGINFTINDAGICIKETHEGFIELFRNDFNSKDVKLIKDVSLSGTKLFSKGNTIMFSKGNKLYKVKMK